jgi:TadE-like protein
MHEQGVGLDEGKHLVQRTHGYAIAEFAMAIPALLIIVAISISLIGVTVTQIQLESAAALGARIIGRGDPIPDSFRNSLPKGTEVIVKPGVDVVEVTLKTARNFSGRFLPFPIDLSASARTRLEPAFDEFG